MDDPRGVAVGAGPPSRTALACGALGKYDPELVEGIARRLDAGLGVVHRDRRSILALDRPAIRWRAGPAEGFAWSEGMPRGGRIESWEDAARELGACGLVVEPRRPYVHSSVSGVAPVYHVDCGDATYFASRIDALVSVLPRKFSADWRAWSTILCLRHVVDARTPFAEVSRLPQFAILRRERGRGRAKAADWPWARVESANGVEEGAPAVVEALREVVGSLRPPVNCLLSGGMDSRLLLCLAAEQFGAEVHAYTANMDVGNDHQEQLAARVTDELGVDHTLVSGDHASYWDDWLTRLLRCDFQHASFPYMVPLSQVLSGQPTPVLDGLAFDTLAERGSRYIVRSMMNPDGGPGTSRLLFRRIRAKLGTRVEEALVPDLAAAIPSIAKRRFTRASLPFRGHPSEASLTLYTARTMRAVSAIPHAVMGADFEVLTPFVDDRVASACLAIRSETKLGARLYKAVFDLVNPGVGELPSTNDPHDPIPKTRARRKDSPAAVQRLEHALREGPLTPHLDGELRRHLDDGTLAEAIRTPQLLRTAIAIAALHVWAQRYSSRLEEPDPAELAELASS